MLRLQVCDAGEIECVIPDFPGSVVQSSNEIVSPMFDGPGVQVCDGPGWEISN